MTLLQTPVIDQRDPRWRARYLGNSTRETIGDYGCLLCCFTLLTKLTPIDLNELMKANDAFQPASADCPACAATFDLRRFYPAFPKLLRVSEPYRFAPAPRELCDTLVEHTRAGHPAIVEVDMIPFNNKHDGHFVLAIGAYGHGDASQVIINDPWRGDQSTLSPRFGATLPAAICRVLFFE